MKSTDWVHHFVPFNDAELVTADEEDIALAAAHWQAFYFRIKGEIPRPARLCFPRLTLFDGEKPVAVNKIAVLFLMSAFYRLAIFM
jgi:hypothetical protein